MTPPNVPGQTSVGACQLGQLVVAVDPDRRLPPDLAGVDVVAEDDATFPGADEQGALGRLDDHRVDMIAVGQIVLDHLSVPAQLATLEVERHDRVGEEVRAGATRSVGEGFGAGERRRVGDAPVHDTLVDVDRRGDPRAAPELTSGFPHRSSSATVSKRHTTSPVSASSAVNTPRSPPVYWAVRLTGTVLTRTVPPTTWGWMSIPLAGVSTISVAHSSSPVSRSRAKIAGIPFGA